MAHELPLKHKEAVAEELRAEAEKLRAEAAKLAAERSPGLSGADSRGQGSARTIVDKLTKHYMWTLKKVYWS